MIYTKGKISIRQVMILFLTFAFSPSIRALPSYVARHSNQASWLSPLIAFVFILPLVFVLHSFFKRYPECNLSEIFEEICGKIAGRIIIFLYLLLIAILTALYTRYYVERLLSTILPNVNIYVFLITMLFTVALVMRKGMVVLARMSEIFFSVILILFLFTVVISIPTIKPNNLFPISRLDIMPLVTSSIGVIGIWVYKIGRAHV